MNYSRHITQQHLSISKAMAHDSAATHLMMFHRIDTECRKPQMGVQCLTNVRHHRHVSPTAVSYPERHVSPTAVSYPEALRAHLWFPAFCINPVEHLEVRRRTVVFQRFAN